MRGPRAAEPLPDVPSGPIDKEPCHFVPRTDRARALRAELRAAGVELGAYDERIIAWLTGWEWSTVAVVTSLIHRAHRR
ncbi:hypothetical protein [Streptomyces buecherae]|uniref:hypothetical protein n=1 Tax=Streptomyces buecherae TaxID=2763006 RepID=UPI001C26CAC0|nr:hypothetical protein [Streptomyces buecherae]